ncbi:retrovirus-related pol polyprotein from transposon TNT 1-94 [Tanacetum coccineum]
MPPKRTTTTPMTDAAIKALIAQRVADALAEYKAHRSSGNGNDSHESGSGRRTERVARDRVPNQVCYMYSPWKCSETESSDTDQDLAGDSSLIEALQDTKSWRSPDFNLFSDQEYSEEEVAETMAGTMEHSEQDRELLTNTFSGSDHEDANGHIEKVLEIVDLFHIPNITLDQVMLRAFPMSLTGTASRWLRNELTGPIITWDGLKTKFLNKYCPPARTAKKMEEINNFQ